jgi:hypothetical protein
MAAGSMLHFEGGLFGPILILMYHRIEDSRKRRTKPLIFWGIMMVVSTLITKAEFLIGGEQLISELPRVMHLDFVLAGYFVVPVMPFLLIPLLLSYNGERGRRAKFLFYSFYPLHFVILAAIAYFTGLSDLSIIWFW